MTTILVVDDEKSIRDFLTIMLEQEDYKVYTAANGIEAQNRIEEHELDVILTDVKMPKSGGLDVLELAKKKRPDAPVIMMTAYATPETAVEAMKKGAYDYISKPFKIEELQLILKNAIDKKQLTDENHFLKTALKDQRRHSNIIGRSPAMKKIYDYISKLGDSNATVLILGESGTGKELVARALHYSGARKNHPFISINCGALPENLLESELFGHEKGSFTGADKTKIGLMEAADKGTFFLDEVSEAPLNIQVKLLRALQEKEFNRVGSTKVTKVDIRFIAASNRDLEDSVKKKEFREDLYYRLKVIPVKIPSLRDRKQDIPLLVDYFIDKYNDEHARKCRIQGVKPEAMKIMEKYNWPGNVRELENVIERAVVLEADNMIQSDSLPDELAHGLETHENTLPSFDSAQPIDLEKILDDIEKNMLLGALDHADGIMNKAAKMLNLSFRSMRYRVKKHKLKGDTQGDEDDSSLNS